MALIGLFSRSIRSTWSASSSLAESCRERISLASELALLKARPISLSTVTSFDRNFLVASRDINALPLSVPSRHDVPDDRGHDHPGVEPERERRVGPEGRVDDRPIDDPQKGHGGNHGRNRDQRDAANRYRRRRP